MMAVQVTGRRSATVRRDQTIIVLLETLARERELRPDESVLMERTVRRLTPPREVWRWHAAEDRQILDLIHRRKRLGRPKPFQRNDEVRLLAEKLGRTYMAVHRRIERLRKKKNIKAFTFYRASEPKEIVEKIKRPTFVQPEGTVGPDEAAQILGVPVSWLTHLRSTGGGPKYVKEGGKIWYIAKALRRFPAQQIRAENVAKQEGLKQVVRRWANEYERSKCSDALDEPEA